MRGSPSCYTQPPQTGRPLVNVHFRGRKNLTHKVISMNGFTFLLCSFLFTEWQQSSLKNTCFFLELKNFQLRKNQINSVQSRVSSEKNAFGFWKYFDWAQMCFCVLSTHNQVCRLLGIFYLQQSNQKLFQCMCD